MVSICAITQRARRAVNRRAAAWQGRALGRNPGLSNAVLGLQIEETAGEKMKYRGRKMVLTIIAVVVLLPVLGLYVLSLTASPPANLGATGGRLAECPDSPNCVSSQADDDCHNVVPIRFQDSPEAALRRLRAVLESRPRTTVVAMDSDYLRAEARSKIFRFTDDVEFLIDDRSNLIHVRSASRVGHSDFGANRERIESIRQQFQNANSDRISFSGEEHTR